MDDEALVPAVEMGVGAQCRLKLLQQSVVCAFPLGMHGGAYIVQDAHKPWRILSEEKGEKRKQRLELARWPALPPGE